LDYLLFDDRRADAIAQFSNRDVGTIFRVSLGYVDSSILYNYDKEGANRHLFIHQAMSRCIQELGAHVVHVVMDRSDDLFFCRIELEVARQQRSLDCGIADGYAIAIITERPFYISQKALENYVK
jgi:bifunctional DNase/RNase